MDGNGRWAKKKLLPRLVGHNKGLQSVRKIIEYCIKYNVNTLTIYAFSTENWKRPKNEITFLFKLLENFLRKKINEIIKKDHVDGFYVDVGCFHPKKHSNTYIRVAKVVADHDDLLKQSR